MHTNFEIMKGKCKFPYCNGPVFLREETIRTSGQLWQAGQFVQLYECRHASHASWFCVKFPSLSLSHKWTEKAREITSATALHTYVH